MPSRVQRAAAISLGVWSAAIDARRVRRCHVTVLSSSATRTPRENQKKHQLVSRTARRRRNLACRRTSFTTAEARGQVGGHKQRPAEDTNKGLRTAEDSNVSQQSLAPALPPKIGRSSTCLSQLLCSPKAERVVGSYHDATDSQSGMCGAAAPAPRVASSRPAARPMARPRDGADQQKRRHPIASTQGQLGLGRGPPPRRRRRRRESTRPREGESRGPARLV